MKSLYQRNRLMELREHIDMEKVYRDYFRFEAILKKEENNGKS